MERRSFLKGLLAAPIAATIAGATARALMHVPYVREIEVVRRYGDPSFADLVTDTVKKYRSEIMQNITQNNPLLQRLKDRDSIK